MWWVYNSIGMLVYDGLFDAKTVYGLMGPMTSVQWDKWKEIIYELRIDKDMPSAFIGFEHLGLDMKRLEDEGYHIQIAKELSNPDK